MDGRQEFSLDGRHSHPHLPALTPRVPGAGFSEAPPPHVPGPPGGLGPRQAASADLARVGTPAGGHPGQGGHPGGLHPHFGHGHGKYGYPHSVQSLGSAGSSYPFLAGYLSGGAPPQHQPPAEAYKPGVPMQYPWPHPSTMEAGFSRLSAGGMYPGHFHPSMAPLAPPHDQNGPLYGQYLHSGPASSQPQSSVLARLYEAGKGLMNGSHGSPGFGGLHLHATSRHSTASASVSQAPDQKDVSRSIKSSQQPKESERSSRDHSSKERERTVKSEENKSSSDSNHVRHGDTSSKHDSKSNATNLSDSTKKETSSSSSEKTSSGHSNAKSDGDSAVKLAATTEKKNTIPMSVLDKKKAHARSPDLHSKEPPKPTPTDSGKLGQTEHGSSGEVGVAGTSNSATTTAAPVHTVAPTHKSQPSQHGNGKSVTTVTTTSSSFQPRMTYYSHSIQAQPEKETRKSLVCAQTYIPPLENGEQPNTFLARKLKSSAHQDKSRSNSPVSKTSEAAGGSDKSGSGTDSSNSRTEVLAIPVGDARGPSELNGHAASRAAEPRAAPNGERTKSSSEPSSRRHSPNSDRKSEESSKSSSSCEQSAGRTSGNAPSQDRRDKDAAPGASGPQKDMIRIHDYPYRDIIHEYGQPRSAVTLHDAPATVYSHSEAPEMRHLSQMSGLHPEGARMHPEWRMPGSCASAASHMAALAAQHGYLTPDHPKFLEFYPNKDRSFLERSWPPTPFSQDSNHDRHRSSEPGKPDTKPASGSSSQPEGSSTHEHSPRESTQEKSRHQDRPSPQHRDVAKASKTSKSTTPSPAPSSKSETAEETTSSRKTEKQQVSDKAEKVPAVGESSPYSASVAGKGIEGRRPPVGIAVAQQRAGTEGAPSETGAPAGTGQSASNSAATTDRGTRASRPENADSSSDESEIPPRAPADRCQSAPSAHHDKDREQFLREQRELAAEMALRTKPQGSREVMNDLSGNLVVTGGASLPSNSPWASSLASHPHVPPHMVTRGSPAPAMWFSHYPYPGLSSHPPPPGVGLEPGALPLAPHGGWQLARDPVTGGLVLVPPGTPLANPGGHQRREMLERQQQLVWSSGSAPPPPSHLQHAHHLQLMSQQHQHQQHMELLRQQELRHAEQYQIALHQHHAQEEQKRWEAEEKRKQDQEKQQQQQAEKCGTPRTWAHEDPALEKAGRAAMEAYLQAGIPVAGQPPYGPFPYPHPPYQYIYDQPALMRLVSSSAGSSTVTTTESSRDKEQAAVTTTTSVHTSVSLSVSVSSQSGKQREEADAKKSTEPSKEEPSSVSKAAKDTEKSVAKQAIETSTQTTPEPERMQPIDQPLASSKAPPTDFQPIKTEGVTPHHGTEAESTQAIVPSSTEERPRSPPQATVCSQSQATNVEQSTESVGTSVAATSVEKQVVTKTEMPAATPQQQTQLREMSVQAETMVTSVTVSTMAVTMSKSMVTTSLQNVDPELLQATEGMALLSRLAEEKSRSESGVAAVKVKVERQSVTMASVCTSMAAAAAAMTTDMSQHEGTGPEDSLVHSWGRWKWRSNLKLPQKEEQGTGSAFKLQSGPEGMDLVELEMRMKLAELQRRYKEKQRELARLQRKREKKRKKENGPVKRGPGRPRKRRFHQNSPKSSVKSGEGPSKVERRSKSPKGALHLLVEEMESEEPPKKKKKVTKDSAQQPAAPTSKPKGKKGKGKETAAPDEQEVKLEPPKSKKSKKSDNQPTKKGAKASSAVSSGTNKKSAKDDGTTSKHKPKASTSSDTTSEESGGKSKGKSGSNSNKNTGAEEKTQTQKGKGKKKDKDSQASATSTTKGTGQGSKKSKDKTTTSNTPSRKRSFSLTQSLPQSDDSDDDLVNEDVFWSSLPHPAKAPSSKTSPKTTKKSKDGSKPKKKQKTEDSKVKVPKVKKTVTPKAKPKKVDEGSDSDSDEDDFSRRSHSEDDWSDADLDIDTMTYSETSGLGLLAKYAASSAASMPIAPSTSKKRKKPSNNDDADDEAPATEVKGSKKRKPTQPSKKTTTSASDTPTPKKPKKSKNTSTEGKVSRPKKKKVKEPEPVEDEVPLLDDDAWARRRSERIFLHEPPTSSGATTLTTPTSPTKGPSATVTPFNKITSVPAAKAATPSSKASPVPSGKTASSTPSGKVKKTKTEKNEETSTKPSSSKKTKDSTKETPAEPLVHPGDAPVSKPKKKTSKASKAAKEDATQTKKASKPKAPKKTPSTSTPTEALPSTAPPKAPKVKASTPVVTSPPPLPAPPPPPALPTPTPMEQDSVSNESFSDGENLPLSNYVDQQRPSTPEPRLVNIQKEELRDGLRVIIPIDGLFHTGYVDEIQPPDVYGVVIDGQRGHRPQVYSQEQILQEALHDVKPGSVRFLPEGARVCAYWSQQYRCLYPGTVARMSPSPDGSDDDKTFVSVEFDDGDSGRIPLDHVRLLPPNYPVVDFSMNPIMLHGKRRRRSGDVSKDGLSDAKGDTSDTDSSTVLMDQKEVDNVVSQPEKTKAPTKKASTAQSRAKKGKAKSESVLPLLLDYDSYTGDLGVISEEEEEDGRSSSRKSSPKNSPKASPARSSSAGSTSKKSKKSNSGEKASKLKSKDSKKEPKVKLDSDEKPSPIPKSKANSEKFSKPSTASEDQKPTKSSKKEKKVSSDASDESASTKGEKKKTAGDTTTTKKTKKAKKAESSDTAASDSTPAKKTTKKDAAKQAKKDTGAQEIQKSQKGKASDVTAKTKASSAKVAPPDFEEESNLDDSEAQSFADSNSIAPSNVTSDVEDDDDISEDTRSERSEDIKKPTKKPPARGSKTRRRSADKTPSVESRSKIAPFLPARQLWRWSGKSTQRRGVKGKGKKVFYKAIQRGHEIIRVGDSAVFMSTGRPNLPYVGRIENLWESWGGNMVVKVKWFYHPEETIVGRRACDGKMALYQSSHVDENDVQTISHRCEVVSPDEYERKAKSKRNQDDLDDLYYCAGTYDPTNGALQNVSGPL